MSEKFKPSASWFTLYLWLVVVITYPTQSGLAQQNPSFSPVKEALQFNHLTREDGLPSDAVSVIMQDSRGFMWFGTTGGLARYDGYEMKVFKNDPNDPKSLSSNIINTIYEDRREILWVGTNLGLHKFDRQTESFQSYLPIADDPLSINDVLIFSIYEDRQGLFWIGTWTGGLNLMDREQEIFFPYKPDPQLLNGPTANGVRAILEDPQQAGRLWVGGQMAGDRHGQFDVAGRVFIPYARHTESQKKGHGFINAIYLDHANQLWLGTQHGLDRYDREQDVFITYHHDPADPRSLSHDWVTSIFEDQDGTLWIGGRKGLDRFDRKSDAFHRYQHDPNDPKSLGSDRVTAVFEDRSGVLWVGTYDGGVSYTARKKAKFQHVKREPGRPGSLSDRAVAAIYQDRAGTLWIGTNEQGLDYFDEEIRGFRNLKHDPDNPNSLSQNSIWSIGEDREGMIWIGTNSGGLNRYDRKSGRFTTYRHDPNDPSSLAGNYVRAILESRNGTLWIATTGGLQQFERETETFRSLPIFAEEETNRFVACLYEGRDGMLWGATGYALFCLNPETGAIRRFLSNEDDPGRLRIDAVIVMLEDNSGNIWAGSMMGLIKIVFPKGEKFDNPEITTRRYTEKDGLPGNLIVGLLEDDDGRIWISTANGLSLFRNPSHDESEAPDFKNYDLQDGMQGYEFNNCAFFKNAAGEMFFGGEQGFNVFHPDRIRDNPFLPPVVITSFESFDLKSPEKAAVTIKGITDKKELTLSYLNNIFSIDFAALNYREGHKNQYAYQLEGFNDRWIPLGTDHRVTFTNLNPGAYTFRVKGANNDGIWNEAPTELKIVITPPWWKTGWAYALYTLGVMIAVYSWRRYDLNRRQLKHDLEIRQLEAEKLKEVDSLKSRFFANVSHDFRTPLTLILGPLDELIAKSRSKANLQQFNLMQRSAQGLLRLVNQLLDISKLESGKMRLEARYEDMVPFVKGVFYAFESLAKRKGIEQQFETTLETAPLYFDRDKMEQILTNVLSNAFKFTAAGGTVTLRMESIGREDSPPFLQITVSDTGTGIAADQLPYVFDRFYQSPDDSYAKVRQGSGIGLALVKELVALHHGRIEVSSEVGRGTQFTILFPFGKAHLQAGEIVEQVRDTPLFQPEMSRPLPIHDVGGAIRELLPPADEEATEEAMVLLVEDNDDMRAFIRRQLGGRYRVVEASDGREGMEKALETIPDLVICDVMMPRMDGLQLCDALKKDERTSHIPVILLTSKADIESRLAGLERGADAYLAKPFNREELLAHSRMLLDLRRRLRERYASLQPPAPAEDRDLQIEDAFLQKIRQIVLEHLSEPDFDMGQFSQEAGMSRSQLFRKVKALTGQSPSLFIRAIRLERAKELLQTTDMNVTEVAYEVGFSTLTYFSDAFLEAFGMRPSQVRK